MIKKIILIVFLISSYIFIVSTDPQGDILNRAKTFCNFCFAKYKEMNLEFYVKTWPKKDKNYDY